MSNSLKQEVEQTFRELISMLSSIDEKKFNSVPFEGSWTPGQLADHLFKSYDAVNVLKGRTEAPSRPYDQNVQGLKDIFLNFETKMESPDFIIPSNEPIEKEKMLQGLRTRTNALMAIAENDDLSLLCLDFAFPANGCLTRFEWLSFINFHTMRHNNQLKKIISAL
ncbi:DinB family protein [Daejeonella lutea]|uniref:DinB superfamily protein n=1 Tax=Daejeonella lutea TaxID=572036 RepID=A0A1T5BBD5_9SPHI|nr:DinB family protein [Daejeonella lutea]SKB44320.1 DinB superfamily protein [Daejeonella lutea]